MQELRFKDPDDLLINTLDLMGNSSELYNLKLISNTMKLREGSYIAKLDKIFPTKMTRLKRLYLKDLTKVCGRYRMLMSLNPNYETIRIPFETISPELSEKLHNHRGGACLTYVDITHTQFIVKIRASIAPWSIQFDLNLFNTMLRELGIEDRELVLEIDKMRGKKLRYLGFLLWYRKLSNVDLIPRYLTKPAMLTDIKYIHKNKGKAIHYKEISRWRDRVCNLAKELNLDLEDLFEKAIASQDLQ